MKQCKRCGSYNVGDGCLCRRFFVGVEEWDATSSWERGRRIPGTERLDFREQWARSSYDAAVRSIEHRDCGEYAVLDNPVHAVVVDTSFSPYQVLRFAVAARQELIYDATPAPEESPLAFPDYRKMSPAEIVAAIDPR